MARTDPTIYMRIPEELKEALDTAAAENKRSLTAEVVARLESTFAEGSAWSRAFPHAAAAAFGLESANAAANAVASQHHLEETLLRDRVRSLEAQAMQVDSQALQLLRDLSQIERLTETAGLQNDQRQVDALRDQRRRTTKMIQKVDEHALEVKRALDEARGKLYDMYQPPPPPLAIRKRVKIDNSEK